VSSESFASVNLEKSESHNVSTADVSLLRQEVINNYDLLDYQLARKQIQKMMQKQMAWNFLESKTSYGYCN
jgi:hypothetical protein